MREQELELVRPRTPQEGVEDGTVQRELGELRQKLFEAQQNLDRTEQSLQQARKKVVAQGAELQTLRAQLGPAWASMPMNRASIMSPAGFRSPGPPPGAIVSPTSRPMTSTGIGSNFPGNVSTRSISSARNNNGNTSFNSGSSVAGATASGTGRGSAVGGSVGSPL